MLIGGGRGTQWKCLPCGCDRTNKPEMKPQGELLIFRTNTEK